MSKDKPDTALSLRRTTSTSASDLTKAMVRNYVAKVDSRNTQSDRGEQVNIADLLSASDTVTSQIKTYDLFRQILPDIEIIESIVSTGILKPKDNQDPEFIYNASDTILGNTLVTEINRILKSHFSEALGFEKKLEDIIRKVLFRQGSYPIMVLPEGTIEDALQTYSTNYSAEGFNKTIEQVITDTLATSKDDNRTLAFESYKDDSYLLTKVTSTSATDKLGIVMTRNVNVLKIPALASKLSGNKLSTESINASGDAVKKSTNTLRNVELMRAKLDKRKTNQIVPTFDITKMRETKTKSLGHPIVFALPAESVIPVLSPAGDNVICYLVVLDNKCNPIRNDLNTDQHAEISKTFRTGNPQFSQMQQRLNNLGFGSDQDITDIGSSRNIKRFWDLYAQKFEETIRKEIEDGVSAGNVQFKADATTYQLMFIRLLQGLQTRILNVPADMLTYIAFDTNEFGIGKSLIEKNKITGYIRANLHLSGAVGALQNSINHKEIAITLDAKDRQPKRTVANLVSNVIGLDTNSIPTLMAGSPAEMLNYVARSGYSIVVDGENKEYPNTRVALSDKGRNVIRPDTDYMDTLRRMFITGLWTTPETVDAALQGDLATPMIINNAINTNRYATANSKLCEFVTTHFVQYIANSSILMSAIEEAVKRNIDSVPEKYNEFLGNNTPRDVERTEDPQREDLSGKVNDILEVYLATFSVTLPKPNTNSIQAQAEAVNNIIQNTNAILDVIFSDDAMYGVNREALADEIKLLKSTLITREISRWSKETGYLQDIFNLDIVSEDEDSLAAIIAGLSATPNAITKSATLLAQAIIKAQTELKADVAAIKTDRDSLSGESDGGEGGDDNFGSDGDTADDYGSSGQEAPDLPDADESESTDVGGDDEGEMSSDEDDVPTLPETDGGSSDTEGTEDSESVDTNTDDAPELPEEDTSETTTVDDKPIVADEPTSEETPELPDSPEEDTSTSSEKNTTTEESEETPTDEVPELPNGEDNKSKPDDEDSDTVPELPDSDAEPKESTDKPKGDKNDSEEPPELPDNKK